MSVGFNIVLFSTNRADLVDLLEWKHGRRIENVMSTLSGFVAKCGSSVASLMVGFGLQLTGYVAGAAEQTAGTINMIISYQSAVPLVFGIIMLLISLKVKLDEEVARMNAEKAAKGIS
jgi:GPH family glycoside/pentoside/hexuronide:cation symporter